MKKLSRCLIIGMVATVMFGGWVAIRAIKAFSFENECGAYIKRAANASTIQMANEEISKAIIYLEKEHLTSGTVSIFFENPKNDVGYWYNNIKTAKEELERIPIDASQLEKNTALLKLHETLTDSKNDKASINAPSGISIYPNNVLYFCWCAISLALALIGWIVCLMKNRLK